jgi:hypothetical protein
MLRMSLLYGVLLAASTGMCFPASYSLVQMTTAKTTRYVQVLLEPDGSADSSLLGAGTAPRRSHVQLTFI